VINKWIKNLIGKFLCYVQVLKARIRRKKIIKRIIKTQTLRVPIRFMWIGIWSNGDLV